MQIQHDEFHIREFGNPDNPSLFCIHGWASNSHVFEPLAKLFKDHFHFVCVDLPGFGESKCEDAQQSYQLPYLIEGLLSVAPEKSAWLGWSLGGMLAVQAAAKLQLEKSDRIEALVSMNANAKFIAHKSWKSGVPQPLFDGFMESIADVKTTLRRFAALTVVGEQKDMLQSLKWLQQNTQVPAPTSDVLNASLKLLAQLDNRATLKQLTLPTLHLLSTDDAIVPNGVSQELNKLNPMHPVSFVPNGSHASLVAQPQSVANGILTFLEGLNA
ncbi:alpha/beta fold hydrolase [Bermanella marisrubri]|uniref:BioH protein n=1 Tax=Bermanella marisrubri TaxID=207949 RepID=Q1MZV8_9GAMM|nr:alpha/beta fold hydrolase [Bermanella marisrubri]EAT11449.1 bioH protein [Oceanobacter sp. RED65] [Bermanella marisrubri]QIZ85027.1 alpha/beta fold hydrolase [Bermanella marisrubri]